MAPAERVAVVVVAVETMLLLLCCSASSSPLASPNDFQALLAIKALISDPFGVTESWRGSDYCAWPSVKCNEQYRVIALDLESYFPEEVGNSLVSVCNLSMLQVFNLSFWSDTEADIPECIYRLPHLLELRFTLVFRSGIIPLGICNLSMLRVLRLDLVYSSRAVYIPDCLYELSHLSELDFLGILPTGSISPAICNLSMLQVLFLEIPGPVDIPECLYQLPRLSEIHLKMGSLTASISPAICNMSMLQVLEVMSEEAVNLPECVYNLRHLSELTLLVEFISPAICNLSMLRVLSLEVAGAVDIPECFDTLHNLSELVLAGYNYTIPRTLDFCRLSKLRVLDLVGSRWNDDGHIPACIFALPELRDLRLDYTELEGVIPNHICSLNRLETLSLSGNLLSGAVPECVCSLEMLSFLDLRYSMFEAIPSCLGNLSRLNSLFIGNQNSTLQLTRKPNAAHKSLESLCNLSNLQQLSIEGTALREMLPRCLPNRLQLLSLSVNNLTGSVHDFLARLPESLIGLDVSGNALYGSLPPELGNMTWLDYIDLSENSLSGVLPPSLGNLSGWLMLSHNFFTGVLPPSIGQGSLYDIDLGYNRLQGPIPPALFQMPYLETISLERNEFSGKVPRLINATKLELLNLRNNRLEGTLHDLGLSEASKLRVLILAWNRFSGIVFLALSETL